MNKADEKSSTQSNEAKGSLNNLVHESSLYLKHHATDPIHWNNWSEKSLLRAKAENKLILLSSGYHACHWCHVIQRESFKNPEVAEYLNKHYFCIKLDREEHPDIDFFYQQVLQGYSKRGGWPLHVFLTPSLIPLFAGTYFPAENQGQVPSFLTLSTLIYEEYLQHGEKLIQQGKVILASIKSQEEASLETISETNEASTSKEKPHFPSAQSILNALAPYADKDFGGWGPAPKFPIFSFVETFLDHLLQGALSEQNAQHLIHTVLQMAAGGVNDQVKGGIHRYSTDQKWFIPHFEKMLYDQAGWLRVLSKGLLATNHPFLAESLKGLLQYLEDEMLSIPYESLHSSDKTNDKNSSESKSDQHHDFISTLPYFFSSQDADTMEEEGQYYLFSYQEFTQALKQEPDPLSEAEIKDCQELFSIHPDGNYLPRQNILAIKMSKFEVLIKDQKLFQYQRAKKKLQHFRSERLPGLTDNKAIAAWNAMTISALSMVSQYSLDKTLSLKTKTMFLTLLASFEKIFITPVREKNFSNQSIQIRHVVHANNLVVQIDEPIKEYVEDYVFYLECLWREYQLTANKDSLKKITTIFLQMINQFTHQGQWYWNNQKEFLVKISTFDQSYKSPLATLYYHCCLWKTLPWDKMDDFEVKGFKQQIQALHQHLENMLKQASLRNPLAHGEALKGLIYPRDAFKCLSFPKSWLAREELIYLMPFLGPRFSFYYDDHPQVWSICTDQVCEANGEGLESFISKITGKTLGPSLK